MTASEAGDLRTTPLLYLTGRPRGERIPPLSPIPETTASVQRVSPDLPKGAWPTDRWAARSIPDGLGSQLDVLRDSRRSEPTHHQRTWAAPGGRAKPWGSAAATGLPLLVDSAGGVSAPCRAISACGRAVASRRPWDAGGQPRGDASDRQGSDSSESGPASLAGGLQAHCTRTSRFTLSSSLLSSLAKYTPDVACVPSSPRPSHDFT